MAKQEKKIRILVGRLAGQIVPVLEESLASVKAKLDGGTITLPKQSPTGIRYFEDAQEVSHGAQ